MALVQGKVPKVIEKVNRISIMSSNMNIRTASLDCTSNYSSPEKNVAISALHQDLKGSPENCTTLLHSANKDPNFNSKKLYEISEIYSTMKINDTPECLNDSKDNQMFLNYFVD